MGEQIIFLKDRLTAISNTQNIRILQTRVNNDIYNKNCRIHNNCNTAQYYEKYCNIVWLYPAPVFMDVVWYSCNYELSVDMNIDIILS